MHPGLVLILGILVLVLAVFVFWPHTGLISRWRKTARYTLRERMEDALKHLYDYEQKHLVSTGESLSGVLGISRDDAAELITRLQTLGLTRSESNGIRLTEEGRAYALRVIRVHRLWERYLADTTGVAETDWHREAERMEHRVSSTEAEALAAQMGNPRFDPHGDPIPTAGGDLPSRRGESLVSLRAGEGARVIHIEDEPTSVYAQLVSEGIAPGLTIRLIDSSPEGVRIESGGKSIQLPHVVAANITVVPLADEEIPEEPYESLSAIAPGEEARVVGIAPACRGVQRRRLLDLGIIPGTRIAALMKSAGGDPVAYEIRGATIALRNSQAQWIHVRREEEKRQ